MLIVDNLSCPRPVVVDVPHAGRQYPKNFRFDCSQFALHQTEDRFADVFFEPIIVESRHSIVATFPRTWIDVNRRADPNDPANVVRQNCLDGSRICVDAISELEYASRLSQFYEPYHAALKDAIQSCMRHFGTALHFNLHSFPSVRTDKFTGSIEKFPFEVCLGNRNGKTARPSLLLLLKAQLEAEGFATAINDTFSGGFLLETASSIDSKGVQSIQIEVRRDCYLENDFNISAQKLADSQARFRAAFNRATCLMLADLLC
jgi:N-formylglutamate deformylase